ncbi:MAG: hypothetical protein ACM3O9_06160, partial [Methylocystaceae bacterium]
MGNSNPCSSSVNAPIAPATSSNTPVWARALDNGNLLSFGFAMLLTIGKKMQPNSNSRSICRQVKITAIKLINKVVIGRL